MWITPLAYGGVVWVPQNQDVIQALDAVTGDLLWEYSPPNSGVEIKEIQSPVMQQQGWYNPPNEVNPNDHFRYFQYNVERIPDAFVQQEGEIYWLDISVFPVPVGTMGLEDITG